MACDSDYKSFRLSLTVDAPAELRNISFNQLLTQLILEMEMSNLSFPMPGDGYSMDSDVQAGCVHAMLKTKNWW